MPADHDSIVGALRAIARGHDTIAGLNSGSRRWVMHVPAEPDSDPDLVLSSALGKAQAAIESLVAENARLRGLVNQIHPLAEGLAIRCEILESVRDRRLSLVTTEDLTKHAGDTSASIYAALDRILADANAPSRETTE